MIQSGSAVRNAKYKSLVFSESIQLKDCLPRACISKNRLSAVIFPSWYLKSLNSLPVTYPLWSKLTAMWLHGLWKSEMTSVCSLELTDSFQHLERLHPRNNVQSFCNPQKGGGSISINSHKLPWSPSVTQKLKVNSVAWRKLQILVCFQAHQLNTNTCIIPWPYMKRGSGY